MTLAFVGFPMNGVSESRTCHTEGDALHPTFSRHRVNGSRLPDGEEQANDQGKQALRCVWGPLAMGENRGTKPGIGESPYGNLAL